MYITSGSHKWFVLSLITSLEPIDGVSQSSGGQRLLCSRIRVHNSSFHIRFFLIGCRRLVYPLHSPFHKGHAFVGQEEDIGRELNIVCCDIVRSTADCFSPGVGKVLVVYC